MKLLVNMRMNPTRVFRDSMVTTQLFGFEADVKRIMTEAGPVELDQVVKMSNWSHQPELSWTRVHRDGHRPR